MWAREKGAQSKHQKIKISFIRRIKLHLDTKRALILLLSARERSLHFATYIIIIEERAEVPYSWNESNIVPGAALSDGVWTVKRTFNSRRIWKKMLTLCSTVESWAVDVMESICERKIVLLGLARAHEYHIFNIKKNFLRIFTIRAHIEASSRVQHQLIKIVFRQYELQKLSETGARARVIFRNLLETLKFKSSFYMCISTMLSLVSLSRAFRLLTGNAIDVDVNVKSFSALFISSYRNRANIHAASSSLWLVPLTFCEFRRRDIDWKKGHEIWWLGRIWRSNTTIES